MGEQKQQNKWWYQQLLQSIMGKGIIVDSYPPNSFQHVMLVLQTAVVRVKNIL
jgi:hypothetical protein